MSVKWPALFGGMILGTVIVFAIISISRDVVVIEPRVAAWCAARGWIVVEHFNGRGLPLRYCVDPATRQIFEPE